jgi:hypothetical protein
MSLILYTTAKIDTSEIRFIPTETVHVNDKKVLETLPKGITILPAVVKRVAGQETIIQGEKVFDIEPLTIQEQVSEMNFFRK